jgi:hypothetical protein
MLWKWQSRQRFNQHCDGLDQTVAIRPILLKKSGLVSAVEKYASEIEIFTFGRGFQTQISRSSVQKRRFHWSLTRQFWMTDFFNRIGQKRTLTSDRFSGRNHGH